MSALLTFAWTATACAASLPPVQITYSGQMSLEVFPTKGKPAHQLRTLSWNASAGSGGADGSLALDYTSVSGSASSEGNNNCYDATTTLSLAAAKNPVAGGWSLNETSDFPSPGWKYVVLGVPTFVPVLEAEVGRCSSDTTEALPQPNQMLLVQETFSPAQTKEYEALMESFEFTPGTPATRTRTFSFDGISHCTCLPEETHVKESMTLTVSATSPASGNDKKTEPGSGGGAGPGPKGTATPRARSEARRKQLKEQAREDLGPALEEAWKAHGLATAIGLNYGVALSTALDELGQNASLLISEDATARVINDYRIIKDPPDRRFKQLAKPRPPRRVRLPSCVSAPEDKRAACASLRVAETAMLGDGARAGALSDALLVTIDRDSGAIRARDYTSAQRQYVHFESLRRELQRELKRERTDAARVAATLHGLGVSSSLSAAQSSAAIAAVEARLGKAGISPSRLATLAGNALSPHEADALQASAQ